MKRPCAARILRDGGFTFIQVIQTKENTTTLLFILNEQYTSMNKTSSITFISIVRLHLKHILYLYIEVV